MLNCVDDLRALDRAALSADRMGPRHQLMLKAVALATIQELPTFIKEGDYTEEPFGVLQLALKVWQAVQKMVPQESIDSSTTESITAALEEQLKRLVATTVARIDRESAVMCLDDIVRYNDPAKAIDLGKAVSIMTIRFLHWELFESLEKKNLAAKVSPGDREMETAHELCRIAAEKLINTLCDKLGTEIVYGHILDVITKELSKRNITAANRNHQIDKNVHYSDLLDLLNDVLAQQASNEQTRLSSSWFLDTDKRIEELSRRTSRGSF